MNSASVEVGKNINNVVEINNLHDMLKGLAVIARPTTNSKFFDEKGGYSWNL